MVIVGEVDASTAPHKIDNRCQSKSIPFILDHFNDQIHEFTGELGDRFVTLFADEALHQSFILLIFDSFDAFD